MTIIGEAWGFRIGEDIEFRLGPLSGYSAWTRGKILRFDADRNIYVRDTTTTTARKVANPRNVRHWQPPSTIADIEKFLEDSP